MASTLSPLDGRYASLVDDLRGLLSEEAIVRQRCHIELRYLRELAKQLDIDDAPAIVDFPIDIDRIQEIEQDIHHDVKAVEYYLREHLPHSLHPWIHFGLTSEDIDSVAYALSVRDAVRKVIEPAFHRLASFLAQTKRDVVILGHTHGQPATPTPLAKEMFCFRERFLKQLAILGAVEWTAKFGGATGNFIRAIRKLLNQRFQCSITCHCLSQIVNIAITFCVGKCLN